MPSKHTRHSCSHEDKMVGLVWLVRAGLQNKLWSNQTHNQIHAALVLLNDWNFKHILISRYVTACKWLHYVIHRGAADVPSSWWCQSLSISLFVCVTVGERACVIPATSLCFLPQDRGAHYITQSCVRQLDTHTDTHGQAHFDVFAY